MKNFLAAAVLIFLSPNAISTPSTKGDGAIALCYGRSALQVVFEKYVNLDRLADRGSKLVLGRIGELESSIRSVEDGSFELQLYDPTQPARYYTTGPIDQDSKSLELAIWSHHQNVDFACRPLGQSVK